MAFYLPNYIEFAGLYISFAKDEGMDIQAPMASVRVAFYASKAKAKQYKTELKNVLTAIETGNGIEAQVCLRRAMLLVGATQRQADAVVKKQCGLLG